jgi:hypothetical protein
LTNTDTIESLFSIAASKPSASYVWMNGIESDANGGNSPRWGPDQRRLPGRCCCRLIHEGAAGVAAPQEAPAVVVHDDVGDLPRWSLTETSEPTLLTR